ncbi:class I SAM-dependent methyltransferase [Candidatus Woesearchaeota archaeon]|jgi:16S rRNA (guanine1207-N2)-methyltransferase|nr:class I SAM-dependent methyltransferase [Candidatus Woesearchaeota archaeon]
MTTKKTTKKTEHYFSKKQTSEFKIDKIIFNLQGDEFKFCVAPGVFSKNKVDKGTEVLVKNMIIIDGDKVLDLGCGYGVVGVVVKSLNSDCSVVFTDSNERAIILTQKNLRLNKIKFRPKDIRVGDMYQKIKPGEQFDTILLNPPQTAGKKVCFAMIEKSKDFLVEGGRLQLVARHSKGGKDLSKKMNLVYGNMREIAKKSGYRVYLSQKISESLKKEI